MDRPMRCRRTPQLSQMSRYRLPLKSNVLLSWVRDRSRVSFGVTMGCKPKTPRYPDHFRKGARWCRRQYRHWPWQRPSRSGSDFHFVPDRWRARTWFRRSDRHSQVLKERLKTSQRASLTGRCSKVRVQRIRYRLRQARNQLRWLVLASRSTG